MSDLFEVSEMATVPLKQYIEHLTALMKQHGENVPVLRWTALLGAAPAQLPAVAYIRSEPSGGRTGVQFWNEVYETPRSRGELVIRI